VSDASSPQARYAEALRHGLMTGPGHTSSELRRAVEARSGLLSGRPAAASLPELPPRVAAYVEKIARHAYRVTDEDIEGLRRDGYSEDAVFEITLSAALGAGLARLERGMAALRGAV